MKEDLKRSAFSDKQMFGQSYPPTPSSVDKGTLPDLLSGNRGV